MNIIQWRPGSTIKKYPESAVVRGVPIALPLFDENREYYKRIAAHEDRHDEQVRDIADNFDPDKFGAMHYCMKCGIIDDGTHRREAAVLMGRDTVDVKIGGNCWKIISRNHLSLFRKTVREVMGGDSGNDMKWLQACADNKWPVIDGNVAFSGRTVLDVGCQVGFTAVEAWKRGADCVWGFDIRSELTPILFRVCRALGADTTFGRADWFGDSMRPVKYDIVFCLGVLHYLPVEEYEAAVRKLAAACKETLVLEMRLSNDHDAVGGAASCKQSLPTSEWLQRILGERGFTVEHRFPMRHNSKIGTRELWICRR